MRIDENTTSQMMIKFAGGTATVPTEEDSIRNGFRILRGKRS